MPFEQSFTSSFVVTADHEQVVRRNKQRIESQFRVHLDFPEDGGSLRKERWINVSAAASKEVCSKVTEFVRALCSPELVSTHQCAPSVYHELCLGGLRELLEREYGVVIENVDDRKCIVKVCGNDLSVALVLSEIDKSSLVEAPDAADPILHDLPAPAGQPPSTDLPPMAPRTAEPPAIPPRSQAAFQLQGVELDGLVAGLSRNVIGPPMMAEADDSADMKILPPSRPKLRARPVGSLKRDAKEYAGTRPSAVPTAEYLVSDISGSQPPVSPASEHLIEIDNTTELVEAARHAGFEDMDIAVLLSKSEQFQSGYHRSPAEFLRALEKVGQQKNDTNADDRVSLLELAQPSARSTSLTEAARMLPTGMAAAASSEVLLRAATRLTRPSDGGSSNSPTWSIAAGGTGTAAATADMVPVKLSVHGGGGSSAGMPRPGVGSSDAGMTPVSSPTSSSRNRAQSAAGTFPPMRSPNAATPHFFLGHDDSAAGRYDVVGRMPLTGFSTLGPSGPRPQPLPFGQQQLAGSAVMQPFTGSLLDPRAFGDIAPKADVASAVTSPLVGKGASLSLYPKLPPVTTTSTTTVLPESMPIPAVLAFSSKSTKNMDVASFARMQGYSEAEIEAVCRVLGSSARPADFMRELKALRAQNTATADQVSSAAAARSASFVPNEQQRQQLLLQPNSVAMPPPSELPSSRKVEGNFKVPLLRDDHPAVNKELSATVGHLKGSKEPSSALHGDKQASSIPAAPLQQQQQKPRGSTPIALVPPTSKTGGSESVQPPTVGAVRQGKPGSTSGSAASSSSKKSTDIFDFAKTMGFTDDDISAVIADLGEDISHEQFMTALKRQQQQLLDASATNMVNRPAATASSQSAANVGSGSSVWQRQQRQSIAARLPTAAAPSGPSSNSRTSPAENLRHIVVDGSNVAMYQGDGIFRCRNLKICVDYFLGRGHKDITVVVPMYRKTDPATRDAHILDELHSRRMLAYQPSKKLPNMPSIRPYDDKLILDIAINYDGVVISNDNYKDLLEESRERDHIIRNRVIMFTIVGDSMFYINDDPMGRHGPSLDELLTRR